MGEGLLGPLFAVFAGSIGGNILDISWAWATYLLFAGVLEIVVGKYSDGAFRKERLLVLGYALNAIFTICYLFVQTPIHLFLVQAGLGIATAFATPTWEALYAAHENRKNAGSTWGLASGGSRIMTGIAIIFGGLIVQFASFKILFLLMGVIQVVAALYQAQILFMKKK